MVAIYSTLKEDLYVVYAGMNPETNLPTLHVFINPLVKWVWWGGMVVVMGTNSADQHTTGATASAATTSTAPSGATAVSSDEKQGSDLHRHRLAQLAVHGSLARFPGHLS